MAGDCLVCRELLGEVSVPGGFLWEDESVVGFHAPPVEVLNPHPYLGHLMVVTRRHVGPLGELTDTESAAIGRVASHLARALTHAAGAEWVYSAVIGTGVPHFHLQLLPRYPGTPRDVVWHKVDEWEGARHGTAEEIAELVSRLKSELHRRS
jgi:diadenosine tetraphosphate (Ap4A) HIT family hydrolase